eukprot:15485658-Alexandrium_andersonii.AAC.1
MYVSRLGEDPRVPHTLMAPVDLDIQVVCGVPRACNLELHHPTVGPRPCVEVNHKGQEISVGTVPKAKQVIEETTQGR